jgi:hypothetical protein
MAKRRGSKKTSVNGAGLVRRPKKPVRRFSDAVEHAVGGFVEDLNVRIREQGKGHDALADHLLDLLFDGDAEAALQPESRLNDRYRALRDRAGLSFKLDPAELLRHVRIGAVNRLRRQDDVWAGIDWSEKVELVPLLALRDGRRKFNAGVAFAARVNVGKLDVRAWVQIALPKQPGSVGRPRGPGTYTLETGDKLRNAGVPLSDPEKRAQFAERLAAAPEGRRRELVEDLKKTHEGLGALLKLLAKQK